MKFYRVWITVTLTAAALLAGCHSQPIREAPPPIAEFTPTPPPPTPTPSPAPTPSPSPLPLYDIVLLFHSARSGNNDIYIKNFSDRSLRQLTVVEADDSFASWSPDRSRIAFSSDREGSPAVYVMSADGSEAARVSEEGSPAFFPSWAPDGRHLAYMSRDNGVDNLKIASLDDGTSRFLTAFDEGQGGVSAFSPDGNKIIFGFERVGKHKIYQLDQITGATREIISNACTASRISWLLDGNSFLYASGKGNQNNIWQYFFRDGRFNQITREPASDLSPSVSPDGRKAAFVSQRNGGAWQLFLADLEAGSPPSVCGRLTFDGHDYRYPDWK